MLFNVLVFLRDFYVFLLIYIKLLKRCRVGLIGYFGVCDVLSDVSSYAYV